MKNIKSILFAVFAFAALSIFVSCSSDKKDENPLVPGANSQVTMTLNGDGYSNQAVTLSNGLSSYSTGQNYTAVIFSGNVGTDSLYFYVVFEGNQTGTKNWDDNNGIILYKSSSSGTKSFMGVSNGTLSVSSYEAVGGKVSGTFSGQIVNVNDTTNTISITNGSFSGVRVADVP